MNIPDLIPDEFRQLILEQNLITKAVALPSDEPMRQLMIIWKTYVEPTLAVTCNKCYARVLENYKNLLPLLIKKEQDSRLLNDVKP